MVLGCVYHLLGPIAEEGDFWHYIKVRLPERILSLLTLIYQEESQS